LCRTDDKQAGGPPGRLPVWFFCALVRAEIDELIRVKKAKITCAILTSIKVDKTPRL